MLSNKEILDKIKSAYWDYFIDPSEIYSIAAGKRPAKGMLTKEKILARLFERLSWYELLEIFGKEFLAVNLNDLVQQYIRNPDIQSRYESIRKILRREALSSSGWSDKNRKRLKSTLLSDRRYSA